jgi:hypothetical protein
MSWRRENQPSHDAAPKPAEPVPEGGQPLQPTVRGRLESRLGHDFSSVRIHERPQETNELIVRIFGGGK